MCKSHTHILKSNKRLQLIILRCLCVCSVRHGLHELTAIKHSNVWLACTGEGGGPRMQCPSHMKTLVHLSSSVEHTVGDEFFS